MKAWMIPWLLPVGMLAAVAFVSISDGYSALIALGAAFVAIPVLWRLRFPVDDNPDADVHYWRIRRR